MTEVEIDREGLPTKEEIEQLFSKLPEGKYAWFECVAGSEDKWALWFAPTLMTGKAKVGEEGGGWHRCVGVRLHKSHHLKFEFWQNDCGNLAFKMAKGESDIVDDILRNAVMALFRRLIEKGLVKFVRAP
jgi:hypothetical protein